MLRRNARLRHEFLFRKSLEGKEQELYEKKRKIRQALEGAWSGGCWGWPRWGWDRAEHACMCVDAAPSSPPLP